MANSSVGFQTAAGRKTMLLLSTILMGLAFGQLATASTIEKVFTETTTTVIQSEVSRTPVVKSPPADFYSPGPMPQATKRFTRADVDASMLALVKNAPLASWPELDHELFRLLYWPNLTRSFKMDEEYYRALIKERRRIHGLLPGPITDEQKVISSLLIQRGVTYESIANMTPAIMERTEEIELYLDDKSKEYFERNGEGYRVDWSFIAALIDLSMKTDAELTAAYFEVESDGDLLSLDRFRDFDYYDELRGRIIGLHDAILMVQSGAGIDEPVSTARLGGDRRLSWFSDERRSLALKLAILDVWQVD